MIKGCNWMLLFIALYCMMCMVTVMAQQSDRILLKDIQTLTFEFGRLTQSRRNHSVAQLTCIDNDECGNGHCSNMKSMNISTVTCHNKGSDNQSIDWQCTADMPSNYVFKKVNISCEGYDSPQDQYILAGSCSLVGCVLPIPGFSFEWTTVTIIVVILVIICCCCCCCCYCKYQKKTMRVKSNHQVIQQCNQVNRSRSSKIW